MSKIRSSGEDYLETILEIEKSNGRVRSIDVANKLGVSRPSVNKAINNLKEEGMLKQEYYGDIMLTEEGRQRALAIKQRHTLIKKFLVDILGVDEKIAEEDACKMEHVVSQTTILKLNEFVESKK